MYTNIYMIYDILFYLLFQLLNHKQLIFSQQCESLKAPIRSCSTELFEKSFHIAKKHQWQSPFLFLL